MKREDDQELWDLLGKAGQPPVSPFFARNVLREIRQQPAWRDRLTPWLLLRRLVPASAVAAVVIAVGLWLQNSAGPASPSVEDLPDAIAQLDPVDFEVVADLDDLLALEEDNLWTDGDVSAL